MMLVRLAVTRPITALVLLVSVLAVGSIALFRLPLAFLPEVDVPFIVVQIPYPNASPTHVEEQITEPVEEALAMLTGVKKMRSTSQADGAVVSLEFEWGQELDVVRMQVSEKLAVVRPTLPQGAGQVLVSSFNTADIPVVQARLSARGVDLSANYPLLEAHVIAPIRRIPGVARVDLDGVAPRQVFVDLVHDRIKAHRIDVGALVRRLERASVEIVLGSVTNGNARYTARGLGSFESLEQLGAMPIGVADLRLRDVAEIRYEEPPIAYGRHLGQEQAIGLSVYKESTANTVEVVDAITRVIEQDIDADPRLRGVELFVWQNQADLIRAGIDGLQRAGIVGGMMAVLCLYCFLRRVGSTVIVALSIPFSVITTCGILYFSGRTLNLLSMMGLMLGVGMLVDNAIVVLEAIDRRRRDTANPGQATLRGAQSVATAVVAATATSIIVFLPLTVGADTQLTTWLREVGITISVALVCSLFSSLLLIPLASSRFFKPGERRVNVGRFRWLEDRYAAVLEWTLRHKGWAALILASGLACGVAPVATGLVESQSFSAQVNERLYLRYAFEDFHYKSQAEAVVTRVEDYLYEHAEEFLVDEVYSFFAENEAGTTIVLSRTDLDDNAIKRLRTRVREGLPRSPGVEVTFHEDAESGGDSTYFSLQLYGRDGQVLRQLSAQVRDLLASAAGVRDVTTSFKHGRNEVHVTIDRDKALRQGVSAQDAAEAFGFTLGGLRLPRFRDAQREIDTWLALRIEDRANLEDLRGIAFPVQDGLPVKLGQIATFETVSAAQEIVRENRRGNAWVRATYEGEDWDGARQRLEAMMNDLDLPTGYTWSWDARTLERDDQAAQMATNFLLALALVYLVLASLFESLTQPFVVLVSVVFALPGAAWTLAVAGTPANLMAQIGLLILMGVVVNNGVVMLDRVNQLRRAGCPDHDAFVQAGRDRLRPILMTAATTVLGLLPLAFGNSAVGGLFYFPLAQTVMGGLLSSAVLTLLALPLVTVGVERVALGLRAVWRVSTPP